MIYPNLYYSIIIPTHQKKKKVEQDEMISYNQWVGPWMEYSIPICTCNGNIILHLTSCPVSLSFWFGSLKSDLTVLLFAMRNVYFLDLFWLALAFDFFLNIVW